MRSLILSLLTAWALIDPLHAETFDSGAGQVTLVELYTSEGCSSCPPAERWLNGLKDHPALWDRLVPVALHVDYWDRLGWADRFADARFSQRQRAYAEAWGHGVVYTPGFAVNGQEWRGGPFRSTLDLAGGPAPGRLTARYAEGMVQVRYRPEAGASSALQAHVALLGFDRETQVRAGENRGRTLAHDFVALRYVRGSLAGDSGEGLHVRLPLPEARQAAGPLGLAVWVTSTGEPAPVQATGGWLR